MDWSYPVRVAASKYPRRAALVFRDEVWTYEELDRRADSLAVSLREQGVGREPIASMMLNEPLTLCLYLACARIGAVSVPINVRLKDAEVRYIVEHSRASTLAVDAEHLATALDVRTAIDAELQVLSVNVEEGEAPERGLVRLEDLVGHGDGTELPLMVEDESQPAMIIYTSGTTGFPKGVVRSHRANLWNIVNSFIGSPRTKEDVELFTLPIFGLGLLHFLMPVLLAGGTVVLDRAFDPTSTWRLLEHHRVTRTFLAPTMMDSLLSVGGQEGHDVSALTTIYCAYEFPEPLRERALDRFGDRFIYMYGLTEAQLTAAGPGEFAADPSSAGKPMGLMRLRVLDEEGHALPSGRIGEIALEGPSLMSEYLAAPDATKEARRGGWLLTGDLGYLDERGNVHMTGRKKEIIKTGGFNVDPVEVENVIFEIPGVREAGVVGAPDEHWGEKVVAFVAPAQTHGLTPDAVVRHCRQRLADYKAPKAVMLVDALPKNPTGKVQRGELRQMWNRCQPEGE